MIFDFLFIFATFSHIRNLVNFGSFEKTKIVSFSFKTFFSSIFFGFLIFLKENKKRKGRMPFCWNFVFFFSSPFSQHFRFCWICLFSALLTFCSMNMQKNERKVQHFGSLKLSQNKCSKWLPKGNEKRTETFERLKFCYVYSNSRSSPKIHDFHFFPFAIVKILLLFPFFFFPFGTFIFVRASCIWKKLSDNSKAFVTDKTFIVVKSDLSSFEMLSIKILPRIHRDSDNAFRNIFSRPTESSHRKSFIGLLKWLHRDCTRLWTRIIYCSVRATLRQKCAFMAKQFIFSRQMFW